MKSSYFSKDIQEFITLLSKYQVHYLIVGGEAVIYHGHIRFTGDVDFFYNDSKENISKLYHALNDFWKGNIPEVNSPDDLAGIIMFGRPPNRMDLIDSISGVSFKDAWENRINEEIEIKGSRYPLYFIGLEFLIKNKKAVNRPKDLEDIKYLSQKLNNSD